MHVELRPSEWAFHYEGVLNVRRTSYFAAFVLVAGIAVPALPGMRTATAADDPGGPPATILTSKLRGKPALAALKAKGALATAAARAKKTEAQLTKILETDATAGVDQTGALFYVEPKVDPAVASMIAKAPKPALPPAAKPANVAPAPVGSIGSAPLTKSTQTGPGSPAQTPAALPGTAATASAVGTPQQGPYPYDSTFTLHSRPSSKVIYLDFTGHNTTNGSAWGVYSGAPYDTDGNPTGFSTSELDDIQSVFLRVAEDFAPFDIDVTTEDPGFDAINRTDASDEQYGTRIAFTSSDASPICGGPCGGNAYYGVINTWGPFNAFLDRHAAYQPSWVFPTNAPGAKQMAEAASHEAGHNFGLGHDGCVAANPAGCIPGVEFVSSYTGHGNWAPIMGLSYYRPVTQWSKGEYANADNTEDDLAIIASVAPFVADDYHQGLGAGGPNEDLGVLTSQAVRSGMINQRDFLGPVGDPDGDSFRFYSPSGGTVRFTGVPAPTSPNLDLILVLYNPDGSVVDSAGPISGTVNADVASGMDAVLTVDLPRSGYFHITVFPSGTDNTGDVGYTNYGTLGRYTLVAEQLSTSGDLFWPVTPTRLLDTRPTPIPTGTVRDLQVAGVAGIPADATAVSLNVAAVGPPAAAGHLRVFPTGTPVPGASALNFAAGKNTPNHVIVKVGAGGKVSIYDGGTTSVIVDINGYFRPDQELDGYVSVPTPTRILSTTLAVGATVNIPVLGVGGIAPAGGPGQGVIAVAVNVGAISPTGSGHLRVWPTGTPMPNASTNNFVTGDSRMNLVVVKQSRPTDPVPNSISVFNAAAAPLTLTVDTVGYFQWGGLGFKPINPIRPLDTRSPLNLVAPGDFREVQIRGFGSIPNTSDVKAVVVNVAAVNPTAVGSIDVGPSGANPSLPSFTHPANENVANLTIVPVGADGKIRIRNNSSGSSHMIVDITGYFTD
jgi:hypothetical protein